MVIEERVNFPAKELMNPNVVSVGPDATLKEVAELMDEHPKGILLPKL
jgi:CBS domain-containing protein